MKRNRFWMMLGTLSLIVTLFVPLVVCAEAASTQKITWVFATNPGPGPNSWTFHPYPRFQNLLKKNSGGRFVLETKVGLYPPNEVVHAVIAGRVPIGWERTPWLAGTFPVWDVGLPFLWGDYCEYEAFLNDPRMVEIEKKTYDEKGLIKIGEIGGGGLNWIWAKKPFAKLSDFKGTKIRTAGVMPTLALKAMGASTISIPTAEIMETLQRGTVDAIQTNRSWGLGFGIGDICKYVTHWNVQSVFGGMLIVNKDKFNALPFDMQKILWDTAREMQGQTAYGVLVGEYEDEIAVKCAGINSIKPAPEEISKAMELTKPVIDEWLKVAGPYGKQILAIAADYASGAKMMLKK